jgi:transmembrane sensor
VKSGNSIDQAILLQSSEWIEALKRGDAGDRERFSLWLLESTEHVRHFLMMTALDEELRHVDRERLLKIERVTGSDSAVVPLRKPAEDVAWTQAGGYVHGHRQSGKRAPLHTRPSTWWGLCAAAAAIFVLTLISVNLLPPRERDVGWQEFRTAEGVKDLIRLPDGSVARLNVKSHIAVRYVDGKRDIRVKDEAEVLFEVEHDATRAFRVHVQGNVWQAVGTRFNVYGRGGRTEVSVLSGRVAMIPEAVLAEREKHGAGISPREWTFVEAGQKAKVSADGQVRIEKKGDVHAAISWTEGLLTFTDRTLEDIVNEVNLYNPGHHIRLEGESVKNKVYSGRFNTSNPQFLARNLAEQLKLTMTTQSDGTIVLRDSSAP